ncbi:MAG: dihydroorotase [Helicobacteraceae bacterium]|jgi:dihydroorotase|nr:dihydroorotase [Helicobacteraceae bacterium]
MRLTIVSPFDAHLHLREGDMLKTTTRLAAQMFAGAVVMPNLSAPIDTFEAMERYRTQIQALSRDFEPIVALFLNEKTEGEIKKHADRAFVVKLYPSGVTTNAFGGVVSLDEYGALFGLMEERGDMLLVHGETNGEALVREEEFAPIYERLAKTYPKLKIVMEHISTEVLANLLDKRKNLYATITLHHLLFTLDDLLGGRLNPHLFCKPIVKTAADRAALRRLAFSAHEKVMFGSDSAPHYRGDKECASAAAGIFSAPVLLPELTRLFVEHSSVERLQCFVSQNAQRVYNLSLPQKKVTIEDVPQTVEIECGGIVPMLAGELLAYRVAED